MAEIEQLKTTIEGWGFPLLSKKAHYFVDGRALCGKWWFGGELEQGNNDSSDNCKECVRRFKKRISKLEEGM